MKEFLAAFQTISQSTAQVLANQSNSVEIKEAATNLSELLQPFYKELEQSATRLKLYIRRSFEDLEYAQAVWESKSRIAAAPKAEIWEHLGDLSGRHFRIQLLSEQAKKAALQEAKDYWEDTIERLRREYFVDNGGQQKKDIGFGDKDRFVKEIRSKLDSSYPIPKITQIIIDKLTKINREVNDINVELIYQCINTLDYKSLDNYHKKLEAAFNAVVDKFGKCEQVIENDMQRFRTIIMPDLDKLTKVWGNITREQVLNFSVKIWSEIENTINSIFNERVKLATQAIEQAIAFCSDFLAKQERYQQETPEQREVEKAWIEQQRHELQQVKQGIQGILQAFNQ